MSRNKYLWMSECCFIFRMIGISFSSAFIRGKWFSQVEHFLLFFSRCRNINTMTTTMPTKQTRPANPTPTNKAGSETESAWPAPLSVVPEVAALGGVLVPVTSVTLLLVLLESLLPLLGEGSLVVTPEELASVVVWGASGDKGNDSEYYGRNTLLRR